MKINNELLSYSQRGYPLKSLFVTYLVVAMFILVILGGACFTGKPSVGIINGFPPVSSVYASDEPRQEGWFGSGFLGFKRLRPVPGQAESETKKPSGAYSSGREDQDGSALPKSYCPVFSESDLMRRMRRCGGIAYYRFCNLDGVYLTFVDEEL